MLRAGCCSVSLAALPGRSWISLSYWSITRIRQMPFKRSKPLVRILRERVSEGEIDSMRPRVGHLES